MRHSVLSTVFSFCLVVAGIICACDIQALPATGEPGQHAHHHEPVHHGSHGQRHDQGSHGQSAQFDIAATCDHQDCGSDCMATGSIVKPEQFPKGADLDNPEPGINQTVQLIARVELSSASQTGPPASRATLFSTPVTRQDLLLQ